MGAKAREPPQRMVSSTGNAGVDQDGGNQGCVIANWFLQSDVVCSSETSDPTGLVTVRTAMVPIDSPRRYIRYAATAPATIVPQNNALFITAPLHGTCL